MAHKQFNAHLRDWMMHNQNICTSDRSMPANGRMKSGRAVRYIQSELGNVSHKAHDHRNNY